MDDLDISAAGGFRPRKPGSMASSVALQRPLSAYWTYRTRCAKRIGSEAKCVGLRHFWLFRLPVHAARWRRSILGLVVRFSTASSCLARNFAAAVSLLQGTT
jgi:hypothetical protein